jgi:LuxR family transcriptional regulator, maltose regulon positive regulatory protein
MHRLTLLPRAPLREAILSSVRQYGITLLTAPLGSGKSTALGQVSDALQQGDIGFDPALLTVIDEFDSGDGTPQTELALKIERQVAAGQRFLIASERRLDHLFPAARVRGLVAEFSLEDFALTEAEIGPFLGNDLSQDIAGRTRRALLDRTEGWIPAWNILRDLLARGASAEDLAHSFSGRDRDLVAYFDEFVMRKLSPDVAQFLRDIVPLQHISASAAKAATGHSDCAALIKAAARECAFFIPLDRNGEVQRLHNLFRDYLVGVAKSADRDRYAASALKAADRACLEEDWLAAARLYSEAGASERAVEILHLYTDDLIMSRGEVQSFRRLVGSLRQTRGEPSALRAEQALGCIIAGDFAGAATLVEEANTGNPRPDEDGAAKLQAIGLCIGFGLERFQNVRTAAPRWLKDRVDIDPRYRTMVAAAQFWSSLAERDSASASTALTLARDAVSQSHSPFLNGWLAIMDAVYRFEHGQVGSAARLLEESTETGMIRDTVNLIRASVALEQGRLAHARRFIHSSLRLGTRHSVIDTSLYGWETAARLAVKDEGLASALSLLDEAEATVTSRHSPRATRLVRLRRAKLILQGSGNSWQGDLRTELESLSNDAVANGSCTSFIEEAQLTLARYYVLSGDPQRAISLVRPIQSAAQRTHRVARWGASMLIYAGALARLDELNRAIRQAWTGIARLAEAGYSTSIADEHVLLMPVIDTLIRRVADDPKVDLALYMVFDQLAQHTGRTRLLKPASDATTDHVELPSLTEMERRVLALAARGHSNADIADQAYIELTTVKWHLKNVFAKLSVRSRTAAVVEARRLGIDV